MKHLRFDTAVIQAKRNDDGFLHDSPIITRCGVFPYRNPDGSTRYELRLPEDVFKQDSLETLKGIPITNGHHGRLTDKTAKMHTIGAVLGNARQDGDNLLADVVVHDPSAIDAGNKELSCGYECELEMKSGVYQGQRYDCIQRHIRYNHLAIVGKGRAGNARFNLDAADAAFFEPETKENMMTKLRLDNGIEYDAAPEIAAAYNKMRQDLSDKTAEKDKLEAEKDTLAAQLEKLKKEQPEVLKQAIEQAKKRIALEAKAKEQGVEVKQDMADADIQKAVIAKIRQDSLNLDGKSDDYIQAAFDMAIADAAKTKSDVAKQRQDMADGATGAANSANSAQHSISAAQARELMLAGQ